MILDIFIVPEIVEKDVEGRNIQIASNVTKEKPEVKISKIESSGTPGSQFEKEVTDADVASVEPGPYVYAASNDQIEIMRC